MGNDNKERFYPGKTVKVSDKQRAYEDPEWLDQPLSVAACDEVGALVRNANDEARWIAKKGLETWRPPTEDSMAAPGDLPAADIARPASTVLTDAEQDALNSAVKSALRYNEGKPELDYLFTYAGGIDAVFSSDFAYYETLATLGEFYRAGFPPSPIITNQLLADLREDAYAAGHSIAHELADTNTRGAKKYEQGNYLLGGNWRQYYRSALSHAIHILNGEERDAEGFSHLGNFYFNVLMACHVVSTGIGTDDRIRAPK